MANVKVTQLPVEVAVEREFVSTVKVTQLPVEVAVEREFVSTAILTQMPIEVAIKYAYPKNINKGLSFSSFGYGNRNIFGYY